MIFTDAPDLPHTPLGGPWALDSPRNRESYLFNFGDMTEQNVDDWIRLAESLGINQIDFHGGTSFRFGDCVPNPQWYPNGRASFKAVIDRLHEAGILAGLHTYAFFIDANSKWVSPVPDPRLGSDATLTLARTISEWDTDLFVDETTAQMSATTGFFVMNSVLLRVDDEIIGYGGVAKDPPYAFTDCTRGMYGTSASSHDAGAKAFHIKSMFGYLAPDPDSTLFTEIAAASADFYNECGFDMMYLDALDGEGILGGLENGWHYGSVFVFELFKRLRKPALMEMSTFRHHLWYVRSRVGAWDHPVRSYKHFIDLHCRSNANATDMFLPAHLGWWAIVPGGAHDKEATFPDDIEYMMAKCAAYECGFSPQGFTPEAFATSHNLQRLAKIIKRWENLRRAGFFTEEVRAKLRAPGREFTIVEDGSDGPRVREIAYAKHKVEGLNSPTSKWTVENEFGTQPVRLRLEALFTAEPYESTGSVTLMDFTDNSIFCDRASAAGVTMDIVRSDAQVVAGGTSGHLTAMRVSSAGSQTSRTQRFSVKDHAQRMLAGGDPSWAKMGVAYSSTIDLGYMKAFGIWVYGDGQGEVLNFQIRSPLHVSTGIYDYYVVVDFTGWRYFELIEPEGERTDNYTWPYGENAYALYREAVSFEHVESLGIWCNNLPRDKPVSCYLSPLKALPLVAASLPNPSVTVNGKTITFPVELECGCFIEYDSFSECRLYSASGDLLREIIPNGDAPVLTGGTNSVEFRCDGPAGGVNARANVSIVSAGGCIS